MATPYEAYRLAPQQYQNPMQTQGSAQQFYAPSASLWGNYRNQAGMGIPGLNVGTAMTPLGPLMGWGKTFADTLFDSREGYKNLGTAKGWGNIATFGSRGAKDKQRDAANARRAAVEDWRQGEQTRLGDLLGQAGADVRADLGGELRQALYAGGDMGDENAINDAMTKYQQRYQQYMLGRTRAGQARQVDAMFSDPRRQSDRAQRMNAERTQGLGQLAEQYRIGQRNNAFNQARRGTMGSSMDVEQQGELGRGRDAGAMAIQSGLDEKARAFRLQDQQQQNALKGLIYADDPNTAAALSRTMEGLNAQGNLVREQSAMNSQMAAQRGAVAQGYSQAFGGAMTAASQPLGYYLEHRGSGA